MHGWGTDSAGMHTAASLPFVAVALLGVISGLLYSATTTGASAPVPSRHLLLMVSGPSHTVLFATNWSGASPTPPGA